MKNVFSVVLVIAVSIMALPAMGQEAELSESIARGKVVYEELCITCHMAEGNGIPSVFPPLAGSDYLMKNRKAAIRTVKFGQEGEITVNGTTYNNVMASQGLNDAQVADVMNYILNTWGNTGEMVTVKEVEKVE